MNAILAGPTASPRQRAQAYRADEAIDVERRALNREIEQAWRLGALPMVMRSMPDRHPHREDTPDLNER